MFCPVCGSERGKNTNFCQNCGVDLRKSDSDLDLPSTSQDASERQPLTFKDYIELKCGESQTSSQTLSQTKSSCFENMKKRKKNERLKQIKKEKKDEVVKINIGIVELDDERLKIKRSSLLPVDVRKSDSSVLVKNAGVEKQLAYNKQLRDEEPSEWMLLYPDMDIVLNIPGKNEPFSVSRYKEELGRPYSRVNLYICKMLHYEIANDLNDDVENAREASIMKDDHFKEAGVQPLQVASLFDEPLHNEPLQVESLQIEPSSTIPSLQIEPSLTIEIEDDFEPEANMIVQQEACPEEEVHTIDLLVHRCTLLKDMLSAFRDPKVLNSTFFVKIIDARGEIEKGEGRGVIREVLTEFWHLFYQSLTVGASAKVPVIRHDYQKEEWKAVARIMLYGYCKEGIFPVALSAVFIACSVHGEECISDNMLLEAFTRYVSEDEREVINQCLENRSKILDNDDLLDVLGSYKCFRAPSEENFEDIISQLAHQELIQRPRYVANCWTPILQALKGRSPFLDTSSILHFYEEVKPTPKKVLKMLEASPGAPEATFGGGGSHFERASIICNVQCDVFANF